MEITNKNKIIKTPVFLNPVLMYSIIWISVILLYIIRLSELLEPLKNNTILLVIGTSAALIFGWLFDAVFNNFKLARPKINLLLLYKSINSISLIKSLNISWFIFGIGTGIEILYFGGSPGLGLIGIGPEIIYTEYGIPGIHGLINSIFFSCCVIQFTRCLINSNFGSIKILMIISILNPFIGMSRQMLISLMLQYLLIYFCIKRPNVKIYLFSILSVLFVLLAFGYIGDIRSGRDHIIELASPTFDYPDWLPSAIIWVYIYLTTPLNNLNNNIDITPSYLPLESVSSFIPSFAREYFINFVGARSNWELVSESFNVSSLLQSFLVDFGVTGSIIVMFFLGIMFTRILRNSTFKTEAFFALIVILHGLVLSFFINLLFHLVFIVEILIILFLLARSERNET